MKVDIKTVPPVNEFKRTDPPDGLVILRNRVTTDAEFPCVVQRSHSGVIGGVVFNQFDFRTQSYAALSEAAMYPYEWRAARAGESVTISA